MTLAASLSPVTCTVTLSPSEMLPSSEVEQVSVRSVPETSSRIDSVLFSLSIFVTVLSFNLLGDGLRDALDPRSK